MYIFGTGGSPSPRFMHLPGCTGLRHQRTHGQRLTKPYPFQKYTFNCLHTYRHTSGSNTQAHTTSVCEEEEEDERRQSVKELLSGPVG